MSKIKYQRQRLKIPASTLQRHLKDIYLIKVPVETSLRRVALVSLNQVQVGTLLRRLKLLGFFYIPFRHHKNVSSRFVLLTYQLRRRDNVSALFRTLKLVSKMGQFLLCTKAINFSGTLNGSAALKYPQYVATISQRRRSDLSISCDLSATCEVGVTQISIGTSFNWLILATYVETLKRSHKLVRLIHAPVPTS